MKKILIFAVLFFTRPAFSIENDIFYATERGDLAAIENFLSSGGDIKLKEKYDITLLHAAALGGHPHVAGFLITHGADVHAKESWFGYTPLHDAVRHRRRTTADLLISQGADMHIKDNWGETPLHLAARFGFQDIAALLIAKGAHLHVYNDENQTPLDLAKEHGHSGIVELFEKLQTVLDLWVMEQPEYNSYMQWLPQELVEDLLGMYLEQMQ